jgi:hypothetical protein
VTIYWLSLVELFENDELFTFCENCYVLALDAVNVADVSKERTASIFRVGKRAKKATSKQSQSKLVVRLLAFDPEDQGSYIRLETQANY